MPHVTIRSTFIDFNMVNPFYYNRKHKKSGPF